MREGGVPEDRCVGRPARTSSAMERILSPEITPPRAAALVSHSNEGGDGLNRKASGGLLDVACGLKSAPGERTDAHVPLTDRPSRVVGSPAASAAPWECTTDGAEPSCGDTDTPSMRPPGPGPGSGRRK